MDIGLIILIALGIAAMIFVTIAVISAIVKKRKENIEDVELIVSLLPNVNCGACGREYCSKFAEDIAAGKAKAEDCPLVSFEARAKIDGVIVGDALANVKQIAFVTCKGGKDCPDKYDYVGDASCANQERLHSGCKSCPYACLGCGDCIKNCPFSAITINEKGVAFVDPEVCVGCGNCVLACPNNLIKLIPYTQRAVIACNNKIDDPGECYGCKVGCIHCNHCVEICPTGAISIKDGVPVIDENKCINCYKCVRVCPNHCISRL